MQIELNDGIKVQVQLIIGKEYYNPFNGKSFWIESLEGNRVITKNEDDLEEEWTKKSLLNFLSNTVIKGMPNHVMNISNKEYFFTDLARKGYNAEQIMERYKEVVSNERNAWTDSKYEWFKNLPNQTKGKKAGLVYCAASEAAGHDVDKNEAGEYNFNSNRIIKIGDSYQIIRSVCIDETEKITLNHIRLWQDRWDKLVCFIVFPNRIELYETDRDLIELHLQENPSEVGYLVKDNTDIFHWHLDYPLPSIFNKVEI